MVFVGFLIGAVLLIVAFVHFDKLLKFQYSNHRRQWEEQGKAGGFFWSPAESPFFSGSLQRAVRLMSWMFGTEEWMRNEQSLIWSVWMIRIFVIAFWLTGFMLAILGFQR